MNILQTAATLNEEAKAILSNSESTSEEIKDAKAKLARATELVEQNEALEEANSLDAKFKAPVMPAALPTTPETEPVDEEEAKAAAQRNIVDGIHVMRYGGSLTDSESTVMREVYDGQDYNQLNYEQMKAFTAYLRGGDAARVLRRQVWNAKQVKSMLQDGMTVAEIKATMVEGQDILGGYAVPVEMGNQIIQRAYGLTVIRQGGATVVQTASKAIEWLALTGGNSRYATNLRGFWGSETKNPPDETNLTYGLENIPVHIYTYKVPMSTSFLEDASNVASVFASHVGDTLGIDEDDAFLVGDGLAKPRGILPSQTNADSLTVVNSGGAAALTMDGLKSLRRGVDSQYRLANRASWIGNNDSGGDIELLVDGDSRYFFPEGLTANESFMGGVWRESEAMADVAANSFSLIYGDLSGYMIVERLGLSIQRYNDSNTGINNVEFHVRRRLGGRLVEPWKVAVQQTAA